MKVCTNWGLDNLQLLWAKDNLRKHNKLDCFDLTLRVPSPKPDSEETVVITDISD